MTGSIRRTAQGKLVDINALRLKNERVRAVGNMNVNAKGDILDADNRPISSRKKQVDNQYRKQIKTNVEHGSVAVKAPPAKPARAEKNESAAKKTTPKTVRAKPDPIMIEPTGDVTDTEPAAAPEPAPEMQRPQGGGLGVALKRAREIRGETQSDTAEKSSGIVKL